MALQPGGVPTTSLAERQVRQLRTAAVAESSEVEALKAKLTKLKQQMSTNRGAEDNAALAAADGATEEEQKIQQAD